jgi:uncharacterized protein
MTHALRVVVDDLYIYPVKSCAPVRVETLSCDEDGRVVGDREWVVVDDQSSVVWQGSHPGLALIHPQLQNGSLSLPGPAGDLAVAEQGTGSRRRQVQLWNDISKQHEIYDGTDGGDAVASLLWRTVGSKLSLVRLDRRALRREGANRLHVISERSYDEFAATLGPTNQSLAALGRFRPNMVVTGCGESLLPFIEEQFTRLEWTVGTELNGLCVSGLCVRCIVPNVDPATGEVDERALDTISRLSAQRYPGEPISFGIYAHSPGPCTLARGDVLDARLAF